MCTYNFPKSIFINLIIFYPEGNLLHHIPQVPSKLFWGTRQFSSL